MNRKDVFKFTSQKLAYRAMLQEGCQIDSIQKIVFWFKELIRDAYKDEHWVLKLIFFNGSDNWFIEEWLSNETAYKRLWSMHSYNLITKINNYY